MFSLQVDIQILHFGSGPRCLAQKGEAGFNTRIVVKAIDANLPGQVFPTVLFHQPGHDLLQGNSVQRVFVGLLHAAKVGRKGEEYGAGAFTLPGLCGVNHLTKVERRLSE